MNNQRILFLCMLFFITGCSEQEIYESSQGLREQECMKLPNITDTRQCLEMADKEYGTYLKDRY